MLPEERNRVCFRDEQWESIKNDIKIEEKSKIFIEEKMVAVNNQFDIIKNELQETKYELDLKINAPSDIEKLVEIF